MNIDIYHYLPIKIYCNIVQYRGIISNNILLQCNVYWTPNILLNSAGAYCTDKTPAVKIQLSDRTPQNIVMRWAEWSFINSYKRRIVKGTG